MLGLPAPISRLLEQRSQRVSIPVKPGQSIGSLWLVMYYSGLSRAAYLRQLVAAKRAAMRDFQPDAIFTDIDPSAYLAALTEIKGAGTETVHSRRLSEAQAGNIRYLVLLLREKPIGFCRLVLRNPQHASQLGDTPLLPEVDDLMIKDTLRGRGYGSAFLFGIEQIARAAGFRKVYLYVEPLENPRAYALYQRLGYQAEQTQPTLRTWEFVDSAGKVQRGEEWVIDMVKQLE